MIAAVKGSTECARRVSESLKPTLCSLLRIELRVTPDARPLQEL